MESVLSTLVLIFMILFAVLSLSSTTMTSQQALAETYAAMQTRLGEQARTALEPIDARVTDNGQTIEITCRNTGSIRLTDFRHWDVIAQYNDAGTPAGYAIQWMTPTDAPILDANQWRIAGIYDDASINSGEQYDRGILNPGEEIRLQIRVASVIGQGQPVQVIVSTASGVSLSHTFRRNLPPVVTLNQTLTVPELGTRIILPTLLKTTDGDNPPVQLIYTMSTLPAQGTLNRGNQFTQADVDSGLVSYTHLGPGYDDQFNFSVSDGEDATVEQAFHVIVNHAPIVQTDLGLALVGGGTGLIDSSRLLTVDTDNPPTDLQYRIVIPPQHGTLSLGAMFTQQQINDNQFSYTCVVCISDSFTFTLSDGINNLGNYSFLITVN